MGNEIFKKFSFIVHNSTDVNIIQIEVAISSYYNCETQISLYLYERVLKNGEAKHTLSVNRNSYMMRYEPYAYTINIIFEDRTTYAFRIYNVSYKSCLTFNSIYYENVYEIGNRIKLDLGKLTYWYKVKVTVNVDEKKRVYYYIKKYNYSAIRNISYKLWERAREDIKNRKKYANQLSGAAKKTELRHAVEQMAHFNFVHGQYLLVQAFNIEEKGNQAEAEKTLKDAKSKFAEAESDVSEEEAYTKYYDIVVAKIKGNSFYNEGVDFEEKAYEAYDLHQYEDAQTYLKSALARYDYAKKIFDMYKEKYKRFIQSILETTERIREIHCAIAEIKVVKFNYNVRNLSEPDDDSSTDEEDEILKNIFLSRYI